MQMMATSPHLTAPRASDSEVSLSPRSCCFPLSSATTNLTTQCCLALQPQPPPSQYSLRTIEAITTTPSLYSP
ncbi:hypothetical protein E2C01_030266 [Portunus trituberculatus]|uniref:Uncharacterized protein n=1 Tax=Portunus trituberculatus TaxID=210409 RepID=A0A5B7EQ02_PORTR|nr:hypothetical protein [Portunus trituberculatus]